MMARPTATLALLMPVVVPSPCPSTRCCRQDDRTA